MICSKNLGKKGRKIESRREKELTDYILRSGDKFCTDVMVQEGLSLGGTIWLSGFFAAPTDCCSVVVVVGMSKTTINIFLRVKGRL